MGSTKIDAPEIKPIDVAKQIRDTSRAYRQATPDIIAAERALRGPMQKLALEDYQTALLLEGQPHRRLKLLVNLDNKHYKLAPVGLLMWSKRYNSRLYSN
jgi:hypothetical protein